MKVILEARSSITQIACLPCVVLFCNQILFNRFVSYCSNSSKSFAVDVVISRSVTFRIVVLDIVRIQNNIVFPIQCDPLSHFPIKLSPTQELSWHNTQSKNKNFYSEMSCISKVICSRGFWTCGSKVVFTTYTCKPSYTSAQSLCRILFFDICSEHLLLSSLMTDSAHPVNSVIWYSTPKLC